MASATTAPDTAQDDGVLSHRQIVTILIGLMMGMFLAALDQTIVATSIRTIADDLHGLSAQAWVTTAYLITSTIVTPLYGKLSDMYGRKQFFLLAISLFTIGSMLCTLSTSIGMLAGFRAVQGLGAGGLFSLSLAIIGDIVPPRERAKYQGYFLAVFGTSSVLGPVIGGFFAGQSSILGVTGWRWVFLVNVPIAIAALFVVQTTLHLRHRRNDHRIDWWGAVTLSVALVPLLIVAEQGRDWGWASGRSITMYAIGAVGIVAFLLVERAMKEEALIPLRLFGNRTVAVASIGSIFIGMGMFGGLAALPLYLQIVKGASPTEAGLLLLPLTLGIMTGSIFSGQMISRTGRYRRYPIIGAALLTAALFAFHYVGADTPLWQTMTIMVFFGIGLGFNFQPLTLAVQNAVSPRDIGVATSSATFTRQIGGTLGTAVFLSILFSTVGDNISKAYQTATGTASFQQAAASATGATKQFLTGLQGGGSSMSGSLNDTSFLANLDPTIAHPFLEGFSTSMQTVFFVATFVLLAAFVVALFLPHVELRGGSPQSERMATERSDAEAAAATERREAEPALVGATPQDASVLATDGVHPTNGSNGSNGSNGHADDALSSARVHIEDPTLFADQSGLEPVVETTSGGRHEATAEEMAALARTRDDAEASRPGRHRAEPGEQL
ncbi:MDR family MFS transporter [Lapillicoccus jejuensis]|uniref:EmrB/QacA subfamily drug resistance transporter n=1 Tax=Lapillicoccus jejuensis TaxID=402171 RepID=A0A542DYG7_9MICO|nr:MDR family MFS transporter [Lapillicoccus jejuensis]TQJ08141.1 EmrB/QacA subfamily drug resistance transporter [Lapillicoccus jejuensis]